MRIRLHKISDDVHTLTIERVDGRREEMRCETRSYLLHDLLHYAVESEAKIETGFWGQLARGKTLADMNDRTGQSLADAAPDVAMVEWIVGTLHGATKGVPPASLLAGVRGYAASLDHPLPAWLTLPFLERVEETMRRLRGHWRATPYGGAMALTWPPS